MVRRRTRGLSLRGRLARERQVELVLETSEALAGDELVVGHLHVQEQLLQGVGLEEILTLSLLLVDRTLRKMSRALIVK